MKKLFSFLTLTLGIFPVLKLHHFSIVMILWFIVAIYLFLKYKTYNQNIFTQNNLTTFFGISLIFWVYLIVFPFVDNYGEMEKILVKTLPVFVFSFGFFISKSFISKSLIHYLIIVFIVSIFLVNSFGWVHIFHTGFKEVFNKNDFYHPTIRLIFAESSGIHIPYLGLLTSFTALLLVYRILNKDINRIFGTFLISFLLISLYVYSARMALGIFIFGFLYIVLHKIKSKVIMYSLLVGIPVLVIVGIWFSPIKERYQYSFETEWVLPNKGQQPHEVNYRFGIAHCSFEILKNNLWFGVGPSNVQVNLNNCYKKFTYKSYEDFSRVTYNTHNQYIDFLLKFGLIFGGLIIISLFYFLPKSNLIYQIFMITIFLSFFTENILDRQMGVVFYSLFNAIFVIYKKETLEKDISS